MLRFENGCTSFELACSLNVDLFQVVDESINHDDKNEGKYDGLPADFFWTHVFILYIRQQLPDPAPSTREEVSLIGLLCRRRDSLAYTVNN